ncbi:hypothetical protein H4Q26_011365 [Puccinia striiformis f. sp. tritici PST-130]|nr:hypothetical protein H4Q26_011365 [Puccinia striiformis f. sp. tritici PST-130]
MKDIDDVSVDKSPEISIDTRLCVRLATTPWPCTKTAASPERSRKKEKDIAACDSCPEGFVTGFSALPGDFTRTFFGFVGRSTSRLSHRTLRILSIAPVVKRLHHSPGGGRNDKFRRKNLPKTFRDWKEELDGFSKWLSISKEGQVEEVSAEAFFVSVDNP